MKKLFAALLSLCMILSAGATAMAAEPDIDAIYELYNDADMSGGLLISPAPGFEDEDFYIPSPAEMVRETLPYKNVNIWLGGEYMSFPDAVPDIVNGRTQAPYRAVLEALGAQVTYDSGKIAAAFPDGAVMNLAIGDKTMTFTKDGQTRTVNMDVAPYIQPETGRTFVPIRFIGETLGLTVTWNPDVRVAYVIDWNKLEKQMDERFTKLNYMLAAAMKAADPAKTYAADESLALTAKLTDVQGNPLKLTLDGKSVTGGTGASGEYTLGADLGGLKAMLEALELPVESIVNTVNGAKAEFIVNPAGTIYVRSGLLGLAVPGMPENAWLKIDLSDLSGGIDLAEVMNLRDGLTMGKLIRLLCEDGTLAASMMYMAPDKLGELLFTAYDALLGDDCITVTGNKTKTYTCKADKSALARIAAAAGDEAGTVALDDITFDFELKMTVKDDVVTKTSAKMNVAAEGIKMTMDVKGTGLSAEGKITFVLDQIGTVELTLSEKVSETNTSPLTAPASGDKVVTLNELMNAFMTAAD